MGFVIMDVSILEKSLHVEGLEDPLDVTRTTDIMAVNFHL